MDQVFQKMSQHGQKQLEDQRRKQEMLKSHQSAAANQDDNYYDEYGDYGDEYYNEHQDIPQSNGEPGAQIDPSMLASMLSQL